MARHEQSVGRSDEWFTPEYVFDALESWFDLDVASPGKAITPWIPAARCLTKEDNGLTAEWGDNFVWMNPPFGERNGLIPWLEKFFNHQNGIALVPDRTSTPWWQEYVSKADLVLFVSPKIKFIDVFGRIGRSPAQGTCLLSLGRTGSNALQRAYQKGLGVLFSPEKVWGYYDN